MKYLDDIVEFLRQNPIYLQHINEDGRINSIENEQEILDAICANFKNIQIAPPRFWYDFKIEGDIFVNIKISDLTNHAADNCSSKLGMGYALTGIQNMPTAWEKFHDMLKSELKLGYDYYFLIINKNDTTDCFWTSLKRIKTLIPNGNNLPFQCDWSANREFSGRSEIDAMRYILQTYIASWDKKSSGYPFQLKEVLANGGFDR